jgi:hypothetical protein
LILVRVSHKNRTPKDNSSYAAPPEMTEALLTKRVSAETITEITSAPGFSPPGKVPSPPSIDDLHQEIRNNLADNAAHWARMAKMQPAVNPDQRILQKAEKSQSQKEQFEEIIKDVPQGFKLVPVLYSKITQEENAAIHQEYLKNVRSRFLQFVGENHADDLKALGISDYGIERMKKGLDPSDADGKQYETNIDHIIERSGSGLWAQSKETDPDQRSGVEPKFRQNHFGNMILLPEEIHEYKNTLNNLQRIGDLQPGQSKWILMMVPERSAQQPGFVCPPQKAGSRWDVLRHRPNDPFRKISHAAFTAENAAERFKELNENPQIEQTLQTIAHIAQSHHKPAVLMANDNLPGKGSLSKMFNDALAKDPRASVHVEKMLKPALSEATAFISNLFDEVAAAANQPKGDKLVRHFADFYHGKKVQALRESAEALPLAETAALYSTLVRVDQGMNVLENSLGIKRGPQGSFNDNAPRKPKDPAQISDTKRRDRNKNSGKHPRKGKPKDGRTPEQKERDAYWAQKRRKNKQKKNRRA